MNEKKILSYGLEAKLGTLNPHKYYSYTGTITAQIVRMCGARLYVKLPNEDYTSFVQMGQVAEGNPIQVDKEGKVWRIKISQDYKWSDGSKLCIEDVLYTFKELFDPAMENTKACNIMHGYISILNAESYYNGNAKWEDVGIKIVDQNYLEITTEEPQTVADVMLHFANTASTLVKKDIYEKAKVNGMSYGTSVEEYVSGGLFSIYEWKDGEYIKLKKNNYFPYSDLAKVDEIHILLSVSKQKQQKLFEEGKLDFVELISENIQEFESYNNILEDPQKIITSINLNLKNPSCPALKNLNFRNAIYYALNREKIAESVNEIPVQYYISTNRIIDNLKGIRYRDTDEAAENVVPNYGYNVELAKEYFSKALKELDKEKIDIELLCGDNQRHKTLSCEIKTSIENTFGRDKITIHIKEIEYSKLKKYLTTWKTDKEAYQMAFAGFAGSTVAPWNALKYHTGFYNGETWQNDQFDVLWHEANYGESILIKGKRLQLTAEMEAILIDQKPFIPVTQEVYRYLISDRIKVMFNHPVPTIGFGWEYSDIK
ncbi:MAG: ABC transporter substrate-binding protein [Maledivibacter sp.]|jgi:oligopeptide transport system substrate-binding protein|nr:ABC transporter substrate-binding protein [Maledivibacter sp.]